MQVGWMNLNTVDVMKTRDPICWKVARDEWESFDEENQSILSFDNGTT